MEPLSRRQFLRASGGAVAGFILWDGVASTPAGAVQAAPGLSDPAIQPRFVELAPNALDPGFIFKPIEGGPKAGTHNLSIRQASHETGLVAANGKRRLRTTIWGYGDESGPTWPGKTIVAQSGSPTTVRWNNDLVRRNGRPLPHFLPVDTSLHWCYSLSGYEFRTLADDGVPIITHLHGGHSDFQFDGNPEFFYTPDYEVVGPQWAPLGGVIKDFVYSNDQPAGTLWYHDHALGITRLNVYAGLAGFYILRDADDTGLVGNSLGLPAGPYELAYAIQDRMFTDRGDLFFPAFPGEPFYDDFITGEGAILPPELFPGGGPTALAEFFGDHMVINGKIWPKTDVEPRNYRMRLLNGCDSRFLAVQFWEVPPGATSFAGGNGPLPFTVVGSDQSLASSPTSTETLLIENGARYDVVFDFGSVTPGNRVIMRNIGGDEPFGGDIPGPMVFEHTDQIMAFDVVVPLDPAVPDVTPAFTGPGGAVSTTVDRVRKVALFEGMDEFGRLQPMLGTAEPATDYAGNPINWPADPAYSNVGLIGQMEGSITWHSPPTENPALGATEEWEIWNVTGDAHPVHLHLVHFEVLKREEIVWDGATDEGELVLDDPSDADGDGTYLLAQPVVQHSGAIGNGFKIRNLTKGDVLPNPPQYVENARKDMVTALPGQVTTIRARFDKAGRYVWHCHILSHEDHEMMRVLHVGPT